MRSGRTLKACILASDFKKIRSAALKSNTTVKIEKRTGLPFLMRRYRKRKLLFCGAVFFCACLLFFTSLVWHVEVQGLVRTDLFALNRILRENGVKRWANIRMVDEEKVKFEILQQLDTVSWVGITVKGTDVIVQIQEREPIPEMLPADQACNLLATKDGVVERLLVKEGETLVHIGDTVRKGQILVSSLKGIEKNHPVPVHAFGEVIARTWTEKKMKQPLILKEKTLTGRQKTRFGIQISKIFINFFRNTGNLYPECDTIEETVFQCGSVTLTKRVIRETKTTVRKLNREEAGEIAEEKLTQELSGQVPDGTEIISVARTVRTAERETVEVSCVFECLENIAVQKKYEPEIQGERWNDSQNNSSGQPGTGNESDGEL